MVKVVKGQLTGGWGGGIV